MNLLFGRDTIAAQWLDHWTGEGQNMKYCCDCELLAHQKQKVSFVMRYSIDSDLLAVFPPEPLRVTSKCRIQQICFNCKEITMKEICWW